MIHEYALEPELVASWHDRIRGRIFIDEFCPDRGRVVSRYPNKKRWVNLLRSAFEETFDGTPGEREKARGRLEELRKKFMTSPAVKRQEPVWDENGDWLANAEKEHERKPFYAILARDNPRKDANVMLEAAVVDREDKRWYTPVKDDIRRTAEEMAKCVAPMLRCATRILFIDPYFRANEDRFRKPLAAFLRIVKSRASGVGVELHTADRDKAPSWEEFRKECEGKLPSILPTGVTLIVHRWRNRKGGETLHPRYVLTDIGGVQFDKGLDEGEGTTPVSAGTYSKHWDDYAGPNFAFEQDGEPFPVKGRTTN